MLDIDHVDNPLEVFEAWKKNDELVKRTALVHITSSKKGIRFVFTANIKDGNLADNQIVFAQALGYPSDSSCIDATRNSFAPKEEDILYMNENLLFDYYDEKYDKKFTAGYRDKNTQPLYHQFPTVSRCIINFLLLVGITLVYLFLLLLWPARMVNKGLKYLILWMFTKVVPA